MSSYYWIKLYHEILNDPKMGRLSDRVWRRAIELFLLAGETANEGRLPSAKDIAWRLRTTEEEITEDLEALAALGIVTLNDGHWHVVNFTKRQAASANAERQRQYRDRQRKARRDSDEDETQEKQKNNEGVTKRNTNYNDKFAESDTDIESDTESDIEIERKTDLPPTAGAGAPPPPKQKRKPSPKQQEAQEMFSALANVCQINLTTITGTQRKQLNQSGLRLRKANAIPADMEPFATWWYANDWRGKKGDAPRPAQVRETWGQFKTWREGGQQHGVKFQSTDPRAPNYRPPLIGGSLNA